MSEIKNDKKKPKKKKGISEEDMREIVEKTTENLRNDEKQKQSYENIYLAIFAAVICITLIVVNYCQNYRPKNVTVINHSEVSFVEKPNYQSEAYVDVESIIEENSSVEKTSYQSTIGSLIDINTATIEELDELDGIGPAKAKAIVEYRETNGKFEKIEDIKNVNGIGSVTFEKIKYYIIAR